jgi:antitoxin (DNA-binding transcriptional repressor) of toxin-antitoxin stability system
MAAMTADIRQAERPAVSARASRSATLVSPCDGYGVARPSRKTHLNYAMDRISTSKARKDFRNVVRASSQGKRVKITHYGKTLAGLVPAKDLALLEDCESINARRQVKKAARRR